MYRLVLALLFRCSHNDIQKVTLLYSIDIGIEDLYNTNKHITTACKDPVQQLSVYTCPLSFMYCARDPIRMF